MLGTSIFGLLRSLLILAISACSAPRAQAQGKVWHIGWLDPSVPATAAAPSGNLTAFREGLDRLGYTEGRNYIIDARFADTDQSRLPALAKELVDRSVDVIVTIGTPPVRAAKAATATIPIVMAGSDSPVENGFVASLAHPGGNITGVTHNPGQPAFATKQLQLLKEAASKVSRVAVLVDSGWFPGDRIGSLRSAATSLQLTLLPHDVNGVKTSTEFDSILSEITNEQADALFVFPDFVTGKYRKAILDFASTNRLPSMCMERYFIEQGGLLYYYSDWSELRRRAAVYVDKILRGAKPADLPVEQPSRFELVVNMKTAATLGLTLPQSILALADEVIE